MVRERNPRLLKLVPKIIEIMKHKEKEKSSTSQAKGLVLT
jgi:hypothetical protein